MYYVQLINYNEKIPFNKPDDKHCPSSIVDQSKLDHSYGAVFKCRDVSEQQTEHCNKNMDVSDAENIPPGE